MKVELTRDQGEFIVDLMINEMVDVIYGYEGTLALEEIAVSFGMCKREEFSEWLTEQRRNRWQQ